MEANKTIFLVGERSILSILIDRSFMLINMYELKPFIVMPTVAMLSALGFVFYDNHIKMHATLLCLSLRGKDSNKINGFSI